MRLSCRACYGPIVDFPKTGRGPETCSAECARKWKAARERARRARTALLFCLEEGVPWAERLSPELGAMARRLQTRVRNIEPRDVAEVPFGGEE